MTYKTIQGETIDYPFALSAKAAKGGKGASDAAREVASESYRMFQALTSLDREVSFLRQENQRLKHENQFMIRLINDRENAVCECGKQCKNEQ